MNHSKSRSVDNSVSASPANSTIPANVYYLHMLRARSGGDSFPFVRSYKRLLGVFDAAFILDVINHASNNAANIDGDGFFRCTVAYLEDSHAEWNEKTQGHCIARLTEKGYMEVKYKGCPRQRWVKINLLKLEQDVDALPDPGYKSKRNGTEKPIRHAVDPQKCQRKSNAPLQGGTVAPL